MKGVFLDAGTLGHDIDLSPIRKISIDWTFFDNTPAECVASRIQDCQIVITNKVKLDKDLLNSSAVRCVAVAATGVDHVDIQHAKESDIFVCNVKGYSTASVIQHTIGLIIGLASKIVDYNNLVKQGTWIGSPFFCLQNYPMIELAGKKLGIVGYGAIGQGVASIAQMMGMEILPASARMQSSRMALHDILPIVDFLSLHCPLTRETYHLIDDLALSKMKKGACIVNVSRGGLVDESALSNRLISGHIGGCAMDVMESEPPLVDSPLMAKNIPNLILTPHVAWSSNEAKGRLIEEIALNISSFLEGKPRNRVAV